MRRTLLAALLFLTAPALAETPCAQGCSTDLGDYHLVLPEGTGPFPVLMHLHGMGGTGAGVARGASAKVALARGYAVIAPTGWQPVSRYPKNWGVYDGRTYSRDDIAFLRGVLADAAAKAPIDPDRVLLSGFSRGGSMVWDIACRAPDLARAYAPVAGAFWVPEITACEAPVDLFHTHGWLDRTVPLEGRPIPGATITQGDVFGALFTLREANGCVNRQPKESRIEDARWWRSWSDCTHARIDLMLHPGGHGVPRGWADLALDWFEARLADGISQ
ncbi:MAG: PHB depolymerase family esterase [Pseudomonadota bacterium]